MIRRPTGSTLFLYTPLFFFFFNDTATTEIYTLSLHDALPISQRHHRRLLPPGHPGPLPLHGPAHLCARLLGRAEQGRQRAQLRQGQEGVLPDDRSEEHTSELQSLTNLVCRLLLEIRRAHV